MRGPSGREFPVRRIGCGLDWNIIGVAFNANLSIHWFKNASKLIDDGKHLRAENRLTGVEEILGGETDHEATFIDVQMHHVEEFFFHRALQSFLDGPLKTL